MLPTTIAWRQHTVTCHGTVSRYDRDISHPMSSTNVSISHCIVSVYESHQSAISQHMYPASYQDPIQAQTLTLPTSALTSDYRYRALPEVPNNLSVHRHMIPDHVHIVVRTASSPQASLLLSAPRGVPADS
jgi:hypothetical protein